MATSNFTFQPVPAVAGLYQAASTDPTPIVNPRVGYILPAGVVAGASQAPGPLAAADAWTQGQGTYLFLGATPSNPAAFAAGARLLLATPTLAGTRLWWIQNPDALPGAWTYVAVGALPPSTGGALIPGSAVFGFGNYGVALDGGGLMTSTATGLQIQPPPHAGAVRLTVDDGHTALPIVDGVVTIPLVGPQAGCLCFHVTVPVASASAQPAAIDLLDVGCRFHFDDAGWPGMGLFTSLRYPVFDTSSAGVAFQASMDPLAPLDPVRTRWAFDASQTLASFYRTNLGHAVTLAPAAGSGLVFAPRPRGTAAALRDPLTMVPDGPFALAVPAAGSGVRAQLQCGISGAEFVDITGQSAVLTFVAGQPAFAPSFMPDPTAPPAGTGLTSSPGNAGILAPSVLSTAWAAVSSAKVGLAYHAQPDGAALYGGTVTQGLFPYFQVMAEALPTTPADSRSTSYPLVPYAGLVTLEVPGGDFSPYTGLETQVLGPTRRGAIYANHGPPAAAAPGTLEAITPQGLLATFSADHAYWSSLELAQAGAEQLAFENIVDPLKSALFSSHQFIVISLPSAFQAYFSTNNTLPIDGWRFQMDPGLWGQHGTILIVKNCDKSLADLVSDTGTWALGATFNTSTAATQATLQEIFADAAAALDDPTTPIPAYANFVNTVVGDPGWNGVLFLNCPVPLGGLPDALAALAAGIDASQFYAHHFGINQTPIADTTLTMNDSSLFGLIRYDGASGDGVPPGQQYGFLVNSLYVLFANSLVTTFSSTVTVTLEQLFGAPATQQSPSGGVPSSSLLLTGVLQRHGSAESYVFGESTPTTFTLNDAVLGSVGITQASFSTGATPPAGGGPLTGPQSYRFAFQGALAFNALPGPDLFSFDDLAFANLGVVMTFDASSGNPPSFAFDPTGMVFDVPHSTTRAGALVGHFPLKLTGLLSSSTQKPSDLGYLAVHPPADVGTLGTSWYALSFDLPLGTLGALGPPGAFTAGFVLAWSPAPAPPPAPATPTTTPTPTPAPPPVYVGIKLPGLADHGIPLMGLLKLQTFSNQLTVDSGGAFVLKINGISLGFLGTTLPPGVAFDFIVFGDPGGGGSTSMGWYAAYPPAQTTG